MSRLFYHVMQDNVGNLLFGVTGTMRLAGSGTLATIYGDEALTIILPNPMTNHPSFGSFKCYLGASAAGYDFYMAKGGYTFETLTGVQGLGTMAQQDASAVAITGGTATLASLVVVGGNTSVGTFVASLDAQCSAKLTVGGSAVAGFGTQISVKYPKDTTTGLILQQLIVDAGGASAIAFMNTGGSIVGSINATATATAFNTSSDSRLKHAIAPLTGALDVVRVLRPVHFLWNANDEPGEGFLAHELMRHVPAAVTGEPDEVHPDGSIKPQGVDHSRLVPWLTAALQDAVAQLAALAARVASLEEQLGI